jgi:uncharacterized protein YciI
MAVRLCGAMADHQLLLYDYVEEMAARRGPYRDAHLARIREQREAGRIVMAGALGEQPHGAAIVFKDVDRASIEEFVRSDPYVEAGLVTDWRIESWKLV